MKKFKLLFLLLCLLLPISFAGCENFNKNKLSTPTNISVENGVIIFDTITEAEYYTISINEIEIVVDPTHSNSVNIIDNKINYNANKIFILGESYSIKIKASAEDMEDSNFSNTYSYKHLANISTPTNLKVNGTTLTWDTVKNASYYLVKIVTPYNSTLYDKHGNILNGNDSETINKADLTEYSFSLNSFDFNSILTKAGDYSFYVSSVLVDGSTFTQTSYSNKLTYTYKQVLSTPSCGKVYEDNSSLYLTSVVDPNTNALTISCNGTEKQVELNNANAFITRSSNVLTVNLSTYFGAIDFTLPNKYEFKVKAHHVSNSTSFYTDSEYSSSIVFNKNIEISTPCVNVEYNITNACYLATWTCSSGNASKFKLGVFTTSGIENFELDNSSNSMLLPNNFTALFIQAVGNGNYLSSKLAYAYNPSLSNTLTTLDISIEGTNTLKWSAVPNSYYIVELNNSYEIISTNSYEIDLNCLTKNSSEIKITTFKNNYIPNTTNYILNYEPKLTTPTIGYNQGFVNVNPYLLTFSAIENAIGYRIYIKSDKTPDYVAIENIYTITSIDLSQYISNHNTNYSVKIQAIADNFSVYSDSNLSSPISVAHKKVLETPTFGSTPIEKIKSGNSETYMLHFEGVESAGSYEVLINYNKITIPATHANRYSVDISTYLTYANNYEIKIRAIPNAADTTIATSEYNTMNYIVYKQLAPVGNIAVTENSGVYTLTFDEVENAVSYRVRIVKVADSTYSTYLTNLGLQNPFVVYQYTDISNYLQQQGEYHIYVTALASANGYFADSNESSQYGVVSKLSTLNAPTNLALNNIDANTYNLSWTGDQNADYYLVRVTDPNLFKYEFNVYGATSTNISNYMSVQGNYYFDVYSMISPNSNNSKNYVSSSFTQIEEVYTYTQTHDFERYSICMYGESYNFKINNIEDLKNILWYHTLYTIDPTLKLPIYLNLSAGESINDAILRLADSAASLGIHNFNTDSGWLSLIGSNTTSDNQLFSYLCKTLLSYYPELHLIENFSVARISSASQVFNIYYENALNTEKVINTNIISNIAKDKTNSYVYLEDYLRKNHTSTFGVDSRNGMPVETTEQLLHAIESNKKPLFYGNSDIAETVYTNAKKVLSSIVSNNMSDLEKATRIFDWLSTSFNLNLYADKILNGFDYETADISVYGLRQEFYLEGIFLNITDESFGSFDGEFYFGNKNATSASLSKAYSLLCGIEGISTVSVHGSYEKSGSTFAHSWNKIYINTTSNTDNKHWYNVDIALSTTNINYTNVNLSTKVSSHAYFLVTDNVMQTSLNVAENSNIISLNYATKISAITTFSYYANSSFAMTEKQINILADIAYNVTYTGFEYVKEYSTSTEYQHYSNSGYGNMQAYILNILMYAKYNSLNSFEFCFNWADNGDDAYISADALSYIDSIATSAKNYYSFKVTAESVTSILDNVNNKTTVIITFA